jgi:single-strand DNA-binding protein
MASYNRVILLGNMTRDVELKYTGGGTAVTEIGLAVNDRRKTTTGEWVEETTFVDVTLWGRTAEVAGEYLQKGSQVLDRGASEARYLGNGRSETLEVAGRCERMQMIGSRGGGGGGSREPRQCRPIVR